MKPASIVYFERLFLLSIALGLAQLFFGGDAESTRVGATSLIVASVVAVAISVALAFWASRGRSNLARWLLAAFTVYGLASYGFWLGQDLAAGERLIIDDFLAIAPLLLQGGAIGLLFTPGARPWFRKDDFVSG